MSVCVMYYKRYLLFFSILSYLPYEIKEFCMREEFTYYLPRK